MDIAGKHIVITGAASGIGRAMAQRFHAEGAAKLFLVDLNEAPLKDVAEPLGADYCVCNAGLEYVLGTIKRAEAALGILILCNNAGISVRGGPEVDTADWQRIWESMSWRMFGPHVRRFPPCSSEAKADFEYGLRRGLLSQIGSAPYAVTKRSGFLCRVVIDHPW